MKPFRFFRKLPETSGSFPPCKFANGVSTSFWVGVQIEPFVRPPGVACNPFGTAQGQIVVGASAGCLKDFVDNRPHCKNRRPGINHRTNYIKLADLAARAIFFFNNSDWNAPRRQQNRAHQACDACSDDSRLIVLNDDPLHMRSFDLTESYQKSNQMDKHYVRTI